MECYSCGDNRHKLSEREFCPACEKEFTDGLARAKEIEDRSRALEKAMETGDFATVGEISAEIAVELAQAQAQRGEITVAPTAFVETGE